MSPCSTPARGLRSAVLTPPAHPQRRRGAFALRGRGPGAQAFQFGDDFVVAFQRFHGFHRQDAGVGDAWGVGVHPGAGLAAVAEDGLGEGFGLEDAGALFGGFAGEAVDGAGAGVGA